MSPKRLAVLLDRLGQSHNAGIDPAVLWHNEAQRQQGSVQSALEQVHRELDRGETLAEALANTHRFPPLVVNLAGVGEKSGRIGDMFLTLSEHYRRQAELRRKMLVGSIWPGLQLLAALMIVGLLILIMGFVNSLNTQTNGASVATIDPLGLGLIGVNGLLIYVGGLAAIALTLTTTMFVLGLPSMRGVRLAICRRIPIVGGYLRDSAISRWAKAFSLSIDAGMDAVSSTKLAIQAADWPPFFASQERFLLAIDRAEAFAVAANQAGGYPQDIIDALDHGLETGQLCEALDRLAEDYGNRAAGKLTTAGVMLNFFSWGLVAAMIIAVIFKLAFFYLNLINSLL